MKNLLKLVHLIYLQILNKIIKKFIKFIIVNFDKCVSTIDHEHQQYGIQSITFDCLNFWPKLKMTLISFSAFIIVLIRFIFYIYAYWSVNTFYILISPHRFKMIEMLISKCFTLEFWIIRVSLALLIFLLYYVPILTICLFNVLVFISWLHNNYNISFFAYFREVLYLNFVNIASFLKDYQERYTYYLMELDKILKIIDDI